MGRLQISLGLAALSVLTCPISVNALTLTPGAGGTFTFNLDRNALAPYVFGSSAASGYVPTTFYDTATSNYTNPANSDSSLAGGVGSTEIDATHWVHDITPISASDPGGQAAGRGVKSTSPTFAIDSTTLAGVTGTKLGMTGVQGFHLPFFGGGSTIINGDFALRYNPSARQTAWDDAGLPGTPTGWYLQNNTSFAANVYDLSNLTLSLTDANNWQLVGDLLMTPENAAFLAGAPLTDVGNFSLSLGSYAAVPLPATVWLFASSVVALLSGHRRKAAAL
jgi:hypothetical protein